MEPCAMYFSFQFVSFNFLPKPFFSRRYIERQIDASSVQGKNTWQDDFNAYLHMLTFTLVDL